MPVHLRSDDNCLGEILGSFDPLTQILAVNLADAFGASNAKSMSGLLRAMSPAILVHEMAHFWQISTTASGLRAFAFHHESLANGLRLIEEVSQANRGRVRVPIVAHPPASSASSARAFYDFLMKLFARRLQVEGGWKVPFNSLTDGRPICGGALIELDRFSFCGRKYHAPILLYPAQDGPTVFGTLHIFECWAKAAELIAANIHNTGSLRAGKPGTTVECPPGHDLYFALNALFCSKTTQHPKTAQWGLEQLILVCDLCCMLDVIVLGEELGIVDLTPAQWFSKVLDVIVTGEFEEIILDENLNVGTVVRFQESLLIALGIPATMAELVALCEKFVDKLEALFARFVFNPKLVNELLSVIRHQLEWRRTSLLGGAVLQDLFTSQDKLATVAAGSLPAVSFGSKILSHRAPSGRAFGAELPEHQHIAGIANAIILGQRNCFLNQNPRTCAVDPARFCKDVSLYNGQETLPDCQRTTLLGAVAELLGIKEIIW